MYSGRGWMVPLVFYDFNLRCRQISVVRCNIYHLSKYALILRKNNEKLLAPLYIKHINKFDENSTKYYFFHFYFFLIDLDIILDNFLTCAEKMIHKIILRTYLTYYSSINE